MLHWGSSLTTLAPSEDLAMKQRERASMAMFGAEAMRNPPNRSFEAGDPALAGFDRAARLNCRAGWAKGDGIVKLFVLGLLENKSPIHGLSWER